MKRTLAYLWCGCLVLALAQIAPFLHGQESCATVLREKSLPVKFKTRGSPQADPPVHSHHRPTRFPCFISVRERQRFWN